MNLAAETPVYLSPYSLLVMTPARLIRVYCPFSVRVTSGLDNLAAGETYSVDQIRSHKGGQLAYSIGGRWYSYKSLRIIL